MCGDCLRTTQRNYRRGSWFFYFLAGLFGLIAPLVAATEFKRFGTRAALEAAGIIIPVIGIAAGAGFCIRYFGRKIT